MPCYSATNIRFIGAQQQQQQDDAQFGNTGRAKTAFRNAMQTFNPAHRSNTDLSISRSFRHQCEELFQEKAYAKRLDFNKHTRLGGPKAKYRQKSGGKSQQTMLPHKEFERLKTASKVVTLEDRLDALMKQENESKRLEEEIEETRKRFKEMDDARKRAIEENVEKEDLFGSKEKLKVLERAFLAKHEQEEEVKRVNRIILNAKCHAVRDAQVQEKVQLGKELRSEEKRLEKMVIERAIKSLNEEDQLFEKQKEDKQKYASEIKKQLNERENLRFLEAERIEDEAKMLRRANEALKRDEERQLKLEQERRLKFRAELAQISEMSNLFKKMLCEQEREAEMRIAAYMREKEQRERALKAEKKLEHEALERKQQRIFTLAQKIIESKNQREEMGYLREQEKIEREYRRKEKEAALRKRQIEKELAEAREQQLEETKHRQALQIARAEQDFNNLVVRLKAEEEKQRALDQKRECQRKCYRTDIIRQMSDKEVERRRLQDLERSQAFAWRESERQRDANIRAVINAKLNAMRDACLPEKYIKDVEKQLQKITMTRKVLQVK